MRRVPLNSPEGRRLVERGPAWREHPDYYAPDGPEEIPWHTEADVDLSLTRMRNYTERCAAPVRLMWDLLDERERRNVARVALGMRPQ
jgi:hypothetical protein